MKMRPLQQDLSIYNEFDFDREPVGVKFMLHKPEGVNQLDGEFALCEMFWQAQELDKPFYITKDNENCAGKLAMGWEEKPPFAEYGEIGIKWNIFQEARANSRLYDYAPTFNKDVVNYVVYSPLSKMTFEPDLLVITANTSQAEIILRAMCYSTGEIIETKTTPVFNCSWLFVYPFKSGKVNFTYTGLAFGAKSRGAFPEGIALISIPYQWIPTITQNLKEMEWVLPTYTNSREEFLARDREIFAEMAKEMEEDPECDW